MLRTFHLTSRILATVLAGCIHNVQSGVYAQQLDPNATSTAPPSVTLAIPLAAQLSLQAAEAPLAALSGAFPLAPTGDDENASIVPTLRIPPAWSFSIGWNARTFNSSAGPASLSNDSTSDSDGLSYWALPTWNASSSLPDWLKFDADTLVFYGVTPDEEALAPQDSSLARNVSITMYATSSPAAVGGVSSDPWTASAEFVLQISRNRMILTEALPTIEVTANGDISTGFSDFLSSAVRFIHGDTSTLRMDVDTTAEQWLHWDSDTTQLSGHVPDGDLESRNFTLPVLIQDQSQPPSNDTSDDLDLVVTSLHVNLVPYPFVATSLPDVVLQPGVPFHVSLDNCTRPGSIFDQFSIHVSDGQLPWLHLNDSGALELSGTPPSSMTTQGWNMTLLAAGHNSNITASASITLRLSGGSSQSNGMSFLPMRNTLIALAVVLPLVIAAMGVVGICYWKRRRRQQKIEQYRSGIMRVGDIKRAYTDYQARNPSEKGEAIPTGGPAYVTTPERARTPSLSSISSFSRRSGSVQMQYPFQYISHNNNTQHSALSPNTHTSITSVLDISPTYSLHSVKQAHSAQQATVSPKSARSATTRSPRSRTSPRTNDSYGKNYEHHDYNDGGDPARGMDARGRLTEGESLAQMPSMNFGFLLSPVPRTPDSPPAGPDDDGSRMEARPRSVNSAYDSLPSFDSESTWHAERRRRPPSPAWRRDDVLKGVTLYDHLKEQEAMAKARAKHGGL